MRDGYFMNPINNKDPQIPYEVANPSEQVQRSAQRFSTFLSDTRITETISKIIATNDPNPDSKTTLPDEFRQYRKINGKDWFSLKFPDYAFYGYVNNNVPHGIGTIIFEDGSRFETKFENQSTRRNTIYFDASKVFYMALYTHETTVSGNGLMIHPNGTVFFGEQNNWIPHGDGYIIYPDGSFVDGDFINGKWDGKIMKYHLDGSVANANFKNGERIGPWQTFCQGKLNPSPKNKKKTAFANIQRIINDVLDQYDSKILDPSVKIKYFKRLNNIVLLDVVFPNWSFNGSLLDDVIHGPLTLKLEANSIKDGSGEPFPPTNRGYIGAVFKGRFVSDVTIQDLDTEYIGIVDDLHKSGYGTYTLPDKTQYDGEFTKDKMTGHGKIFKTNGDILGGYFVDGVLDTTKPSSYKVKSGQLYEGYLKYDTRHGKNVCHGRGKITFTNGSALEGNFINGELDHDSPTTLLRNDGSVYKGMVKSCSETAKLDGKYVPHGKGTWYHKDGSEIGGIFIDGNITKITYEKKAPTPPPQMSQKELEALENELCENTPKVKSKKGNEKAPETPSKANKKAKDSSTSVSDENTCTICLDKPRESFFDPCGHILTCISCGTNCGSCPICNKEKISLIALQTLKNADNSCHNCLKGTPDHALVPCGHTGFCIVCIKPGDECPLCSKIVEKAIKVFRP